MTQATVDFAAVGRVSRYSELKDIRLIEVSAKCDPNSSGPLVPEFSNASSVLRRDSEILEISCSYRFVGRTAETEAIVVGISYLLSYSLKSPEPLADDDVVQFASANGTLHSWPFVREFLHALTSRMGFPPFTLGVMHFVPMQAAKKAQEEQPQVEEASQSTTDAK